MSLVCVMTQRGDAAWAATLGSTSGRRQIGPVIARRQGPSPPVSPCEAQISEICTPRAAGSIRNSASRGRWWMPRGRRR